MSQSYDFSYAAGWNIKLYVANILSPRSYHIKVHIVNDSLNE